MKKTVLIYWPKRGNVESTVARLSAHFDKDAIDIFTITEIEPEKLIDYDLLIFGGSTIGADHWEDSHISSWYNFFEALKSVNLQGKAAAIFGLGDQVLYPEHFVDGMVVIRDELVAAGAKIIGRWPVEGYEHTDSKSQEGDHFIGLALDDDQQHELSDERIRKWVEVLKSEVGF